MLEIGMKAVGTIEKRFRFSGFNYVFGIIKWPLVVSQCNDVL